MKIFNNFKNMSLEDILNFYISDDLKIDLNSIYYYLRHKDLNKGLKGLYPPNFKEITSHNGSREDKKLFKKKCKNFAIDENNILVKLKEISDDNGNKNIKN